VKDTTAREYLDAALGEWLRECPLEK